MREKKYCFMVLHSCIKQRTNAARPGHTVIPTSQHLLHISSFFFFLYLENLSRIILLQAGLNPSVGTAGIIKESPVNNRWLADHFLSSF